MAKTVYFDTSVFIEMAAKKSPYKKSIKRLGRVHTNLSASIISAK
jgi:hypothetical protein